MPKNETVSGRFKIIKQEPIALAPEVRKKLMLEAIENLQKIEKDSVGREEVTVGVKHNNPIEVICISDMHIGSLATNNESVLRLVDYVSSHENVGVVLLGDEIEGIKAEYMDTNRTPLDLQQQIDLLRMICLEPLAQQGKILAMVSGYWGHPGWAQDSTTINIWNTMTTGLEVPILQNGGKLNIRFANGHTQSIRIRHNPPGASKVDPVSGLRQAELALSESARTDGSMSGHIHRMAVAQELYFGAKSAVYYISAGTEKGSTTGGVHDRYGEKLGGLPLSDPLGQGVILQPRTRQQREARNYPYASARHGQVAFDAINLLNAAESQGLTKELKETIREKVEAAPTVTYYSSTSRLSSGKFEERPAAEERIGKKTVKNEYSKIVMKAPYDALTYNIQTELPIVLRLIQNVRTGSSSEGVKELSRYLEMVKQDPHSLIAFLRNTLDKEAGKSPNRIEVLDRLSAMINGNREQTLAIMFDESMRRGEWKKTVGQEARHMPVAPASYLSTRTGVPLIHHLSLIKLAIGPSVHIKGKPLYVGAFADKLFNSGSFSQPTFGLKQVYNKFLHEKPGFVAGGHMPSAGVMTFYDRSNAETKTPILVAPGWWAKYVDTMGKGNVMPGADPGQAIIFMPGNSPADYMAFPTVDADQTEYLGDALTLLQGLKLMGLTDKVLKRSK